MKLDQFSSTDEMEMIANFTYYPNVIWDSVQKFALESEAFQHPALRTLWESCMEHHDEPDEKKRIQLIRQSLGLSDAELNELFDHVTTNPSKIPACAHRLVKDLYARRLIEAVRCALLTTSDCYDASAIYQKAREALDAIPQPPSIGTSPEEIAAAELAAERSEEIPERLLHIPGFVDDVTNYSLLMAYNPNRVLSFAGALALAAHLMGRRYTDVRATRTNLFVFALGPSGIGKECPRRVNKQILSECNLSPSVQDDFASGEVLEELLYRQPCTLIQQDEVQKLVQGMKDEKNTTMQGKVKFLMTLYSASGAPHSMRSKATEPNNIGRVIEDPSLTLFGTGIAKALFASMTTSLVEEGLLGRCIMFDTEFRAKSNSFENGRPSLPRDLIGEVQEIAHHACYGRGNQPGRCEPNVVPDTADARARIKAIFEEIDTRQNAADKQDDRAASALWGRAKEKVSKLALIYAVSATRQNPQITAEGVDWAWDFVQFIVRRMLKLLSIYGASGKITKICRDVVAHLLKHKGQATRREIVRIFNIEGVTCMDEVEATLVERGDVIVSRQGRNSKQYRLAPKSKTAGGEEE